MSDDLINILAALLILGVIIRVALDAGNYK